MRITKLHSNGVKGPGASAHELAPVTIVTGDNFAGKTAKLDAIRLGLIGYLPELGKRASDTFALAADGEMGVTLTFDNGSTISRQWLRSKAGQVRTQTVGDVSVPTVLIDPSEYFALGDKDRVRYVFRLAAAHVDGAADAVISRLKGIKIDGHNPQHEAAINELVNLVDESDRERHDKDQPVPEWLEELIAGVRDRFRVTKAEADRMAKTVGGMAVIECEDDQASAKNVTALLAAKREQLAAVQTQIGRIETEVADAEWKAKYRKDLEATIASIPDVSKDIEARLAECGNLASEADKPLETPAATDNLTKAAVAETKARSARDMASKAVEAAMDELEDKKRLKECPFCGAKGEGWLDHLTAEYEQKIAKLKADVDAREAELKTATKALRAAQTVVAKAKESDAKVNNAQKHIIFWKSAIAVMQEKQERREAAIKNLASLPPVTETDAGTRLSQARAKSLALQTEIQGLYRRHEKFIRQQEAAVIAAKAAQRLEQVNASVAVQGEAVKLLEALQGQMVKQAFGAILDNANKLTDGILKSRLEYRDGEIGRYEDGVWISHHSFSGTEKALAYAGISVALAAQSPIRIVLLDEMGRLTGDNKFKVVMRLVELIRQGVIDQALCVDVSDKGYPAPVEVGFIKV